MRRMSTTLLLLVIAKKSRTFSVSYIQLMNRHAGAGREHSQTDSPSWPMEMFHTINVTQSVSMGVGWRAGIFFSRTLIFHRITEYSGLEGISVDHLVQPHC